jgi:16S rRNA processing protein RimM
LVVEAGSDLLPGLTSGTEIMVGQAHKVLVLEHIRPHRGRLLLKVRSIDDRDQAEALRNQTLYLSAEQVEPLPDGQYYYWQILGLEVFEDSGNRLGVIKNIIETGANDVYVIESDDGNEILVPAIEEVIREVDLDQERMTVRLLPGLI